jgi:hypothetical protein
MRSKAKNATRLILYVGLLCFEVSLVLWFYIIPEFEARSAPDGHWEMETPFYNAPAVVWIGLVAALGLVLLGNVGLVVMIWRGLRDLMAKDA